MRPLESEQPVPAEPISRGTEGEAVGATRDPPAPSPVAQSLARLWERHRGTTLERIQVLEDATVALLEGTLSSELREHARGEAHKLAGSLGTFGFVAGTHLAREAETMLAEPEIDGRALAEIAVGLRAQIDALAPAAEKGSRRASDLDPAAAREVRQRSLVVSSDADLVSRLEVAALGAGLAVESASNESDALRVLEVVLVDVLLIDLDAANRGGLAILDSLDPSARSIPVVALGSSPTLAERVGMANRGAHVLVDRALPAAQILATVARSIRAQHIEPSTVLVVDDDPVVLDMLSVMLGDRGLRVVGLQDADGVWDALEREIPDLLVVDVALPGIGGIDLCRAVRTDPRWQRLPILVLTAHTDDETVVAAFEAGADDYVPKPVVGPVFDARISSHLERSRLHRLLVETDPLTGVQNRWQSEQTMTRLIRLAARQEQPFSLALLDLDRFKSLNDRFGHMAGDAVLRRFGTILTSSTRGEDVVGRWGGEEFAVGMYGMDAAGAVERLAGLLETLEGERFAETGPAISVGFSAGIAQFPRDGDDLERLYRVADQALFRAKAKRGCIMTADRLVTSPAPTTGVDVVIVEDDESLSELLVHALQTRGYSTRCFGDGALAAEALLEGQVRANVVLLDITLPGLDGFGVLRRLGERGALETTKVVVLTARSVEDEVLRALAAGAHDHVAKPFSIPVLMQRVHKAFESPR
jgi:diguanylate cyclase (GGDEF)-like protein